MSLLDIDLQLPLGEFVLAARFSAPAAGITALFGRSGSGKTTLLRSVAGLEPRATGRVAIGDQLWQDNGRFVPPHRRQLGYVFQEASLFPHLSVDANLRYGWQRLRPAQRRMQPQRAIELLELTPLLSRPTTRLSGGERQRVAIARALLHSPRLLLLDEPLAALDRTAKRNILPYLRRLQDELAIPMLYVSHDTAEVAHLADQVVLIERGRISATGPAAELLSQLEFAAGGGDEAESVLEGTIASHDTTFDLTAIATGGGRILLPREPHPAGHRARLHIKARDVSIARSAHHDSSIANLLPARVASARDLTRSQTLVQLTLDDGQRLLSLITRRSAYALGLYPGLRVYAQIKGVAVS